MNLDAIVSELLFYDFLFFVLFTGRFQFILNMKFV